MAEKKMIWKQQPGVDYTRKADALIGAVCRYLNTSDSYMTGDLKAVAAILGLEQVEEKPEKEEAEIAYLGDNPIQE